jgi:homoserine acetyltransferase
MAAPDYEIFALGDVPLQSGLTLRNAELAYKTYGRLDAARNNVIFYPTSYGAQHTDTEWLIRPGRALDPERYFIVIPNMFGNGLSSSPGNVGPPHDRGRFPGVTLTDNVRMQCRLLTERLGVGRIAETAARVVAMACTEPPHEATHSHMSDWTCTRRLSAWHSSTSAIMVSPLSSGRGAPWSKGVFF